MHIKHGFVVFLTLSAGFFAPLSAGAATQWVHQDSEVSYKVVHKFHEVEGISHQVEVVGIIDGDTLKVMARAPVSSFNSGNANRDAHVQEVVDASHFPMVTLRILMPKFALPAPGASVEYTLPGEVELHGVKVKLAVVTKLTAVDKDNLTVAFHFQDTLEGHNIERPALLFVKVDDAMQIQGTARVHIKPAS